LGSLYRFQRVTSKGTTNFGFMHIDGSGAARSLWQIAGTGSSGTDDPIPGRIAVSADGKRFLAATSLAAGGNLIEVGISPAGVVDRTQALDPLEFFEGSLWISANWGFGIATDGVWRFDRSSGNGASLVALAGYQAWHSPAFAASADASSPATTRRLRTSFSSTPKGLACK
jgi:hypothetical protein